MTHDHPTNAYRLLEDALADALCATPQTPCEACRNAAQRIVVHRRTVRKILVNFARTESAA